MKKLFAVAILGVAVAAPAPARVDLDQVNAKIDARLHVVLGGLIARR